MKFSSGARAFIVCLSVVYCSAAVKNGPAVALLPTRPVGVMQLKTGRRNTSEPCESKYGGRCVDDGKAVCAAAGMYSFSPKFPQREYRGPDKEGLPVDMKRVCGAPRTGDKWKERRCCYGSRADDPTWSKTNPFDVGCTDYRAGAQCIKVKTEDIQKDDCETTAGVKGFAIRSLCGGPPERKCCIPGEKKPCLYAGKESDKGCWSKCGLCVSHAEKECFEMGMFNIPEAVVNTDLHKLNAKHSGLCAGEKHRQCCFGSENNPRWDDQIEELDDKCAEYQDGAKCMKFDYCTEDVGVRKKGKCVGASNRVCCVPHADWY